MAAGRSIRVEGGKITMARENVSCFIRDFYKTRCAGLILLMAEKKQKISGLTQFLLILRRMSP